MPEYKVLPENYRRFFFTVLFILLFFSCRLMAGEVHYSFIEKATRYYRSELAAIDSKKERSNETDSLLKADSCTTDFIKAFSLSRRIGVLLVEKGNRAAALDIFQDLLLELKAKKDRTPMEQKKLTLILLNIGAIYEESGFWNESLDFFMQSLRICDNIGYEKGKADVYNSLGKVYFSQKNWSRAEDLYKKAVLINKKLNSKAGLFGNYTNLGGVYLNYNQPEKALEYNMLAMAQLNLETDFYKMSVIFTNFGSIYFGMKKYFIALSYLQQAVTIEKTYSFPIRLAGDYLSIFQIYNELNSPEKAIPYLVKSLNLADSIGDPNLKLSVYQVAAEYYKKIGNFKLAADYCFSSLKLSDSLNKINNLTKIEQIRAVYEVVNKEKDNQVLKKTVQLQKMTIQKQWNAFISSILLFVLLAYFLFTLYRKRKDERKQHDLIARQTERLHQNETELLKQNENALLEQLDYKNRQLTSYALSMARNNECVARISPELKQILLEINPKDKERSGRIKQALSDIQQHSSGNDWEQFLLCFQEVHPSFEKNLVETFPDLSPNDKKICALLRLGLTTKDIASFTFRELRSIESARNRLRKKLGLEQDVNIQNYLSRF